MTFCKIIKIDKKLIVF